MEGAARSAKADPSSTAASTASEERSVGPPSRAGGGFPLFKTHNSIFFYQFKYNCIQHSVQPMHAVHAPLWICG